ncbi:hypothetical protein [Emticicia sp. SJ17W-69]|uniref:hypothetical protein n=1 Tax=Emticicia sp. SJ17W-69 TaxID=3421657 RepID=UPI003EBC73A5
MKKVITFYLSLLLVFNLQAQITAFEYFYDNDPGYGNATTVNSFVASNNLNLSLSLNSNNLSAGLHTLFIRAKTNSVTNPWSITANRLIFAVPLASSTYTNQVRKIEYFFDKDPDYGNGFSAVVNATDSLCIFPIPTVCLPRFNTILANIHIPDTLRTGLRTFNVRYQRMDGRWTLSHHQPIIVQPNSGSGNKSAITKAEYFFDKDPGFGHGFQVAIAPANNQVVAPLLIPDTLHTGLRTIFLRTQDGTGNWSLSQKQSILVFPLTGNGSISNITHVEYFFDNDPGIGLASQVSVSPTNNQSTISIPISNAMPIGLHTLYIRTQDGSGRWTLGSSKQILVWQTATLQQATLTKAEYFLDNDPGYGNATSINFATNNNNLTFNVGNVPAGLHTLYARVRLANGQWSQTVSKLILVYDVSSTPIVQMEYFVDTDPGKGLATQLLFTPNPTNNLIATFNIAPNNLEYGNHIFFVRVKNSSGQWSALKAVVFNYTCPDGVIMFSVKSGNWHDSDTWECKRVPTIADKVYIKINNKVNVTVGQTAQAKTINNDKGGILDVPIGAKMNIKPN